MRLCCEGDCVTFFIRLFFVLTRELSCLEVHLLGDTTYYPSSEGVSGWCPQDIAAQMVMKSFKRGCTAAYAGAPLFCIVRIPLVTRESSRYRESS